MQDIKKYSKMIIDTKANEKIGYLDENVFKNYNESNFYILYYFFPLIERLVIEILKKKTEVDIEWYMQGTFRTPKEILNKEANRLHFEKNEADIIAEIFDDNGIRNNLLHYDQNFDYSKINQKFIKKVKDLTLLLIEKYCKILNEETTIGIEKIEYI